MTAPTALNHAVLVTELQTIQQAKPLDSMTHLAMLCTDELASMQ